MHAEPLAYQATNRQAAEVAELDPQRVQQRQHVAAQVRHRVRPRGRGRLAMAAPVVAQHPELARQRLRLRGPHAQVRRSEEQTQELQSIKRNSYDDFSLKKKNNNSDKRY